MARNPCEHTQTFSWLDAPATARHQKGKYAGDIFNQHEISWCGCCYLVAAVQCVEDRAQVAYGRPTPRIVIDMQAMLDHFQEHDEYPGWNACHGGFPLHVLSCMAGKQCPILLQKSVRTGWVGHPQRTTHCRVTLSSPLELTCVTRLPPSSVHADIRENGSIVLEISAETLKACDHRGVATDMTPRESNHAVCVVGWKTIDGVSCWIVRNSWGRTRVPQAVPSDLTCVSREGNECDVCWEHWTGDPQNPGFVYLPTSYLPLHSIRPSPWISVKVTTRKDPNESMAS